MELTLLILEVVAIAASIGDVTSFSTSSGLAPTSVVTTITYGRFIGGSRSVVILVSETTPKTITSTTATNTVYGRFTLYFEIILVPPEKLYV